MASFQAKIGWKIPRKSEMKRPGKKERRNYRSVPFRSYTTRNRKFQKNRKKFKKLKNRVMALFQAKVGRKRPGKRENRNYRSVLFLPDA